MFRNDLVVCLGVSIIFCFSQPTIGQERESLMLTDPPATSARNMKPMPIETPIATPETALPSASLMDLQHGMPKSFLQGENAKSSERKPFPEEDKP